MIVRMLAVSVLALAAGAMAESARASQFFVCEDGRTIEVARGELEAAKRENACVAKHFGLTVKKAPAAPPKVSAKPDRARPAAAKSELKVVLPVRKPQRTA